MKPLKHHIIKERWALRRAHLKPLEHHGTSLLCVSMVEKNNDLTAFPHQGPGKAAISVHQPTKRITNDVPIATQDYTAWYIIVVYIYILLDLCVYVVLK